MKNFHPSIVVIILLIYHTVLFGQDLRIEPPSWWIGMKNPDLQLMIYGKNIGSLGCRINKQGIMIKKISTATSPDYLFVDLIISPKTSPGDMIIQLGTQKINYPLNIRGKNASSRKGFSNEDVIYLVTPDRFANGDTLNDHTTDKIEQVNRMNKNGRHGGDIQGIMDHLDYMHGMGFTILWPTPLLENNLPTYSYHGYGISDFYKIDPRMGTNELYQKLSQQAKAKGISLIMDIVLNHCSSGHWWMKNMPFKDWINYEGRFVYTNNRRESNMDPHASAYDKELMTQGWFAPSMPDLNQRNPFMSAYLIQNSIWWIEYADLSGLRIDTYPYIDKTFSARYTKAILNEYPLLNMVGEEWSYNPSITSYWQQGMKNGDGYQSSLPSLMDFPLQSATIKALTSKNEGFSDGWANVYATLANDFVYADPNHLVTLLDNHDMIRFYTQIKEDFNAWKLGMVLLCTTRGIPQIYYGTEILMTTASGTKDDGEIRADMPGGWIGDIKNVFTKTGLNAKEFEAQSLIKQLLNLRKSTPALQRGGLIHFAPDNGVYTYFRMLGKEKYMVILNRNSIAMTLNANIYKEIISPENKFTNALTHEIESIDQAMKVSNKGYKILKVN